MSVRAPNAAIVIWNYLDRMTPPDGGKSNVNEIAEIVIPNNAVKSIVTSKDKARPGGTFELELAPTHNWVSAITVGSWTAIMMTGDSSIDTNKAEEKSLKMLGRIDSVRVVCQVDPTTGARNTAYLITGVDWSQFFSNMVYIDAIAFNPSVYNPGGKNIVFSDALLKWVSSGSGGLFNTTEYMNAIIKVFGSFQDDDMDAGAKAAGNLIPTISMYPKQVLDIPAEVAKFLELDPTSSNTISKHIKVVSGVLQSYDDASGIVQSAYKDIPDSLMIPNASHFLGRHDLWQILTLYSNEIINELVTDLRWQRGKPTLAIYKRIRPFIVEPNSTFLGSIMGKADGLSGNARALALTSGVNNMKQLRSKFTNIRRQIRQGNNGTSFNY